MFYLRHFQLLVQESDLRSAQQHSILDLVRGSGLVVQGILYLLVLFSVMSWGIIAQKYRQIRRAKRESERFIEIFWERRNLSSIHDASRELTASPVAQVFRSGYEELVRVSRSKKESAPGDDLTHGVGRRRQRCARYEAGHQRRNHQAGKKLFFSCDHRELGALRRLIRHCLGHHERLSRPERYPFIEYPSRGSGHRRGVDCDRGRLGGGDSRVDGVQHFVQQIKVLAVEMDNFSQEFLNIAERHFFK